MFWHCMLSTTQEHGREYNTAEEELMRHTVWESNKKYIDTHNDNADQLGFTLAMNEFGDLVSLLFHTMSLATSEQIMNILLTGWCRVCQDVQWISKRSQESAW